MGKIDSPSASPECWGRGGGGQWVGRGCWWRRGQKNDTAPSASRCHRPAFTFIMAPNQITNIGGQPWLEEISIRLIRPAGPKTVVVVVVGGGGKIINTVRVAVVAGGVEDEDWLLKKEAIVGWGETLGQWVISASGRFSKARGGQPGEGGTAVVGGSRLAPAMHRAVRRGPHLISATLIPTGVPGAPGQPKQ